MLLHQEEQEVVEQEIIQEQQLLQEQLIQVVGVEEIKLLVEEDPLQEDQVLLL
jgi:hypothetical protein